MTVIFQANAIVVFYVLLVLTLISVHAGLSGWRRLGNWLQRVAVWACNGVALQTALAIVLLVGGTIYAWQKAYTESSFSHVGWFLELSGLGYGFVALHALRRKHHLQAYASRLKSYLVKFPKWRQVHVLTGGGAVAFSASGSAIVRCWSADDSSLSLQDRVERVIRNVEKLFDQSERIEMRLIDETKRAQKAEKTLQEAVSTLQQELQIKIRDVEVSGMDGALLGLILIAVGMTMNAVPDLCHKVAMFLIAL